jgi:hypothetical protein
LLGHQSRGASQSGQLDASAHLLHPIGKSSRVLCWLYYVFDQKLNSLLLHDSFGHFGKVVVFCLLGVCYF